MNHQVRDWMTPDVISVPPSATLEEADSLMSDRHIRRLAVVAGTQLTGILSQGDVRAAKATITGDAGGLAKPPTVDAIMTPHPITIPQSASVALAAKTMLQLKVSGLPVVNDDGKLCGILSESDLFRYIVEISKTRN